MYYLDANIFIYATTTKAAERKVCLKLLKAVGDKTIIATTSCETIQEIIHINRLNKKDTLGIKISRELLNLFPDILSVDLSIIKHYLNLVKKYPRVESRDLIHLATCLLNNIDTIITYDKHFQKFSEIKALTPEDIL